VFLQYFTLIHLKYQLLLSTFVPIHYADAQQNSAYTNIIKYIYNNTEFFYKYNSLDFLILSMFTTRPATRSSHSFLQLKNVYFKLNKKKKNQRIIYFNKIEYINIRMCTFWIVCNARRERVDSCLAERTQQANSFLANGVISFHANIAFVDVINDWRRIDGNRCAIMSSASLLISILPAQAELSSFDIFSFVFWREFFLSCVVNDEIVRLRFISLIDDYFFKTKIM
jgi:hypothetical protein